MITVMDSNPARQSLLEALVMELADFAGVREPRFPIQVRVVPAGSLVAQVHQLTRSSTYQPGMTRQTTVIVPLGDGAQPRSVILLDASDFVDFSETRTHPLDLVSGLLEELLHARIYNMGWEQGESAPSSQLDERERDMRTFCAMAHDEYAVGRSRARVVSVVPLFDLPGGRLGERTPAIIWYGDDVSTKIEDAHRLLATVRIRLASPRPIVEPWHHAIQVLYRNILEPLSRSAGFRAGNPPEEREPPSCSPIHSPFYQSTIAPRWQAFHHVLDASFETQFADLDATYSALSEIAWDVFADRDRD